MKLDENIYSVFSGKIDTIFDRVSINFFFILMQMNNKSLNKERKIGLIGSNQNFSNQLKLNDYKVFQYGRNTNPLLISIHLMSMK